MKPALAILILLCCAATLRPPPMPTRVFRPADQRKGAQVLMEMSRASIASVSALSAMMLVGPLALQDVAIARSLSPNTFTITVNKPNSVLQVSTNGIAWQDVENDRNIYSDLVGYDFRSNSAVFFRLKP